MKAETMSGVVTDEEDCLDKLLENVEDPPSVFHDVFSDKSSSESSEKYVFASPYVFDLIAKFQ